MHHVSLIPGDWIGPEAAKAVKKILAAAGAQIVWEEHHLVDGLLTDSIIESCRRTKVVLKGRTQSNRTVGQLPPAISLRKKLDLWATVRPVKALPFAKAKFPDIDVVIIRETSEDIYSGFVKI